MSLQHSHGLPGCRGESEHYKKIAFPAPAVRIIIIMLKQELFMMMYFKT